MDLTAQDFGVRADGTRDDSAGIQAAIDKAGTSGAPDAHHLPERPTNIVFGGPGGRTLFVLAHRTLYSIRMLTARRNNP